MSNALGEDGPLGQQRLAELAELVGVDPPNAVPIIDALATQGLVRREGSWPKPAVRARAEHDLVAL